MMQTNQKSTKMRIWEMKNKVSYWNTIKRMEDCQFICCFRFISFESTATEDQIRRAHRNKNRNIIPE